ncbi:RNA polymerase sigma-70 factor [Niabella ginsengisoli]|uniref:RNA polymerase sigma-70 factor n=1 Tax=Niabella ginsengisoli TaxID=522298 RepID=A0ABS9SGF6_9BACT|nr:RNA polymerase sigma-70 factor [Niabella ginsengisoli]MCH5597437.1 RNA polymerase sigma-70 factor [Niabella ginsengisoli]
MKKLIALYITEISINDNQLAFKNLYQHFSSGLISYANTLLRNTQLSEEAVADVFVKVWANRKMLPTINNLSYYLYTATKHTALNYLSSQKKYNYLALEGTGEIFSIQCPETNSIQKENLQQIEAAINALPEKCKLVFRLIKEEGLRYKEVADLLSLSPKTVEAHMTLAYHRISERLEGLLEEFSNIKKASGC